MIIIETKKVGNLYLNNQIQTLDDLELAHPKDQGWVVVDHGSILQLALRLDDHHVALPRPGLTLLHSLHQDTLLDVAVPGDAPPVVLERRELV